MNFIRQSMAVWPESDQAVQRLGYDCVGLQTGVDGGGGLTGGQPLPQAASFQMSLANADRQRGANPPGRPWAHRSAAAHPRSAASMEVSMGIFRPSMLTVSRPLSLNASGA